MKLTEIISLDCIKVPMESVTKEEAMEELVDLLVTAGKIPDRDRALEALWDRESKGSTGIGGGLAIPHAKYSDASTLIGAIGIAPDGIEFDAEDGEPVYVCVLLLAGMLTAGGCVPKADLDKALDLNRKCRDKLQDEMAKTQQLQADKQVIQDQLTIAEAQARKAESDAASLAAARDDLAIRFKELSEKFAALDGKAPPIPDVGIMLPMQVDKALKAFALANPGLVDYDPRHGMVKIKSDLTFELGSTTATAGAVEALTKLVGIINDPAIVKYHVYIAGHTDNVPITRGETRKKHPNNWYLSVHRAVAIKKVMLKAGLASERIGVMGFGEYHPVAPNKVSSTTGKKLGNKLNRRVEIWIVPPDRFLTSSVSSAEDAVDEK